MTYKAICLGGIAELQGMHFRNGLPPAGVSFEIEGPAAEPAAQMVAHEDHGRGARPRRIAFLYDGRLWHARRADGDDLLHWAIGGTPQTLA